MRHWLLIESVVDNAMPTDSQSNWRPTLTYKVMSFAFFPFCRRCWWCWGTGDPIIAMWSLSWTTRTATHRRWTPEPVLSPTPVRAHQAFKWDNTMAATQTSVRTLFHDFRSGILLFKNINGKCLITSVKYIESLSNIYKTQFKFFDKFSNNLISFPNYSSFYFSNEK